MSALNWVKDGDKTCGYNNWVAETPFGRILITWKGWKEPWNQGVTVDEFPGEIPRIYGEPDEVRDAAEAAYFERLRAATPAQPSEVPPLTDAQAHAVYERWRDTSGAGIPDLIRFAFEAARAQPPEAEREAEMVMSRIREEVGLVLTDPDTDLSVGAMRALLWIDAALSTEGGRNG